MAETLVALVIAASVLLYMRGIHELRLVAGSDRIIRRWQVYAFAGGIAALLVALASPLEQEADVNLVWHMTQHVVLLTVAAPLLAASAPLTAMLYALPSGARHRVQPAWRRLLRSQSDRGWFAWTVFSFALATAALVLWHIPSFYDRAVRNDAVHALEHVSFVATAMLFWWMLLGAGRRSRRGLGVIGVFVATLPATALGVLMTLAAKPWYSVYGHGADALQQQQLAGAVMWGFGGVAMVAAATALFASWLADMERADERARARAAVEPW
jgi:cytochrome c oxidase assembly factor CtaG